MADKLVVKVAVDKASFSFDTLFSYVLPDELGEIAKGQRVLIPFGRGNNLCQGMVFEVCTEEGKKLKSVIEILDKSPIIDEDDFALIDFMKSNLTCSYYEAIRCILPPGLSYVINQRYKKVEDFDGELSEFLDGSKNKTATEKDILANTSFTRKDLIELTAKGILQAETTAKMAVTDDIVTVYKVVDDMSAKLTEKQQMVLDYIKNNDISKNTLKKITYDCGVTASVVKTLIKKELITAETLKREKQEINNQKLTDFELNDSQSQVLNGLLALCSGKPEIALLHGVTGSGKTNIYIKLIENLISKDKNAIVLVPEISLTSQASMVFKSHFGSVVAVLHSALSQRERAEEFGRIKSGKIRVVVGTRSAIFAPIKNLGAIIIDEEQESSYISEINPRYSAANIAAFRTRRDNALLLLCSATPSIETYYKAVSGKIHLFTLSERYSKTQLPNVEIVDIRDEIKNGNISPISEKLRMEVDDCLKAGKQAIILINRRGYNNSLTCINCGETVKCPHCSISLTYHKANGKLVCHYCGHTEEVAEKCTHCSSEMIRFEGYGTQFIKQEIDRLFPECKSIRMDADTTNTKLAHQNIINDFKDKKYNVLIGTQMIAKGLDFEDVTLVGVLSADQGLYSADYKSYERTFSLLTQVVGRSGRKETVGKAVIQTINPYSELLELAAKQDYTAFYSQEIELRKAFTYPPFCNLCTVGFSSENEELNFKAAEEFMIDFADKVKQAKNIPVRMMGPVKAIVYKISGRYRLRVIIKCKNNNEFRNVLNSSISHVIDSGKYSRVSIFSDFNSNINL